MLTFLQAKSLTNGQTIYETSAYNRDGSRRRWRVGRVREWKRDAAEFTLALTHGLRTHVSLAGSSFLVGRFRFHALLSTEPDCRSERAAIEQAAVAHCDDPATLAKLADWFDDRGDELVAQELRAAAADRHLDLIWDHALIRERPRLVPALTTANIGAGACEPRRWGDGTWLEDVAFFLAGRTRWARRALARDPLGNLCLCRCAHNLYSADIYMDARVCRSRGCNGARGQIVEVTHEENTTSLIFRPDD